MPESPRWLEANGRVGEADALLRRIEAEVGLPPFSAPALPVRPQTVPQVSIGVLFSAGVRSRTLVAALIMMVIGFSVFGFIGWLPSFFVKEGFDIVQSLTWTTVMSLGGPAGTIIGLVAADRYGRKPLIVASTVLTSIFGALYVSATSANMLLTLGFLLVTSIYVLGTVGQCIYLAELFDTRYRLRGTGVAATAGRGTTAGVQFFVIWLFAVGGIMGVVGAVIAAQLLLGIVVWLFGIETRNRSLEEIAEPSVLPRPDGKTTLDPVQ
jgi:putative MFS transporter